MGINGGLERAKHWAYRRGRATWVLPLGYQVGAGDSMMFRFLKPFLGTLTKFRQETQHSCL